MAANLNVAYRRCLVLLLVAGAGCLDVSVPSCHRPLHIFPVLENSLIILRRVSQRRSLETLPAPLSSDSLAKCQFPELGYLDYQLIAPRVSTPVTIAAPLLAVLARSHLATVRLRIHVPATKSLR